MLASALSGIPYSLTIHGPSIFQAPERWALGAKIRRSAFTVCISDFTRSQCMLQVPHTEWDRLHVVRCAPDAAFLEEAPTPPATRPRLVWVGRLSEAKAVPLLLAAARRLTADGVDFELVMVGDGPLRKLVEAELAGELAGRVRLAGWLPAADVKREIAGSRALVMPSFAEGLPMVVMEALALGRPVVGTCIAGIPELVEPGVNGWLVPAGSCERLAAALREAVEAPPERLAAMGRAGRQAVERLHHPAREIEKLEALLAGSARRAGR
jgi:glycosyltransferase involved in cell wall biosynthesis